MSLGRNNRRRTPVFPRTPSPLSPPDPHFAPHTRETYQEPAEPPGGSIALRQWLYFFVLIPFYCFRQRKICADLRCRLVSAGSIERHCKSSRNVLSSSRKYTREILHFLRERDFLCSKIQCWCRTNAMLAISLLARLQRRSLSLPTGTT